MRTTPRRLAAASVALLGLLPAGLGAQARIELKIAATTDVHGRLRGWDYYGNAEDPARGLSRAATIIDSVRRANRGRVVLVDAGDLLQGNAMTFVAGRMDSLAPHPVVAAMNLMRYDALAIGNHEFNYGLGVLDRAAKQARFPFLAANTERLDGGRQYAAMTMVTRAGARIAIIGATTPGSMVWDRDHLRGRMRVNDLVAALPAQVAAARRAGADVVLVVAHSGLDGDASYDTVATGLGSENAMARVAREVPGIDLIVFGHSHREVADTTINGVLLMQPRNWATSVGIATLSLARVEGKWTVASKHGVVVRAAGHAEMPAIVRTVARAHAAALRYSNEVIGHTEVAWRTDSARVRDMALIDLIQAVQLKATGADLSVASAFTVDATLLPGPITVAQIAQLYPYENSLRAVRLSGAQVRAFLEHSARFFIVEPDGRGGLRTRTDPRIPGYNYDIIAGAEYAIDLSRPMGARITGLTFRGRPIADRDSFTVAVNNYRAGGAGGYAMLQGAPTVFTSPTEIRELLIAEVRRVDRLAPQDVFVENWRLIPPRRSLRVIAFNDLHGAFSKRPDGSAGNRGGAAELAAMIGRARTECLPGCVPVVLHGGDLFQGTPASNLAYGRTAIGILRAFGVQAGALGNHDFDWGQDTLRARMRGLGAPMLGANVTYADGSDVPWIPDDTLLLVDGVKVGVIGIADEATPRTTMPKHVADLRFTPPVPVIRAHATALRARGAEAVIVVAHIGGFCDRDDADKCDGAVFAIANALAPGEVDAIVSGHTHSQVGTVVNGIPIVQARSSARALGVIDIALGERGARPSRPEVRSVTSDSITPDPMVVRLVQQAESAVSDQISARVVELTERLPRGSGQYALGNLIADAQRIAGRGDIGVMNNGGIRTELREGTVTWGDVYEVAPFGNRLVAVSVLGDALLRYLEALVAGNSIRYHVSGVRIEYDSAAAPGARLRRVTLGDGSRIDDRRRYRVIMSDFMAAGGDGAALGDGAIIEELNRVDLDALLDHLRAQPGGRLAPTDALKAPRITAIK
ncbi:MAG: 5'-nucleotidase C-terminal domain-containing protein [Gemmatimonadetes bacterium]|nr:5'-nucleotidase C-terminal domain-containing protein [Gemmatimonadota bacterium]